MNQKMRVLVEEIARIALEDKDYRHHIAHELDLSDECLEEVCTTLEEMV